MNRLFFNSKKKFFTSKFTIKKSILQFLSDTVFPNFLSNFIYTQGESFSMALNGIYPIYSIVRAKVKNTTWARFISHLQRCYPIFIVDYFVILQNIEFLDAILFLPQCNGIFYSKIDIFEDIRKLYNFSIGKIYFFFLSLDSLL